MCFLPHPSCVVYSQPSPLFGVCLLSAQVVSALGLWCLPGLMIGVSYHILRASVTLHGRTCSPEPMVSPPPSLSSQATSSTYL